MASRAFRRVKCKCHHANIYTNQLVAKLALYYQYSCQTDL